MPASWGTPIPSAWSFVHHDVELEDDTTAVTVLVGTVIAGGRSGALLVGLSVEAISSRFGVAMMPNFGFYVRDLT